MMHFTKISMLACMLSIAGFATAHAESSPAPVPASPNFLKKAATLGPWGYGCVYPNKTSGGNATICTVGRAFAIDKDPQQTAKNGVVMFLRQTADMQHVPLTQQPWGVSVLFPATVAVDQSVPAQFVVDQGPALPINWQGCAAVGCNARVGAMSAEFVQALKAGKQGHFVAKQKNGTLYSYDFTLDALKLGMTQVDAWIQQGELKP